MTDGAIPCQAESKVRWDYGLPQAVDGPDEILSLLAHELRSPLANVIAWAALLKAKLTPAQVEVRRGLDVILSSARTQARLIDDVLDARRLELGKVRLQMQPVSLNSFVEQIVASHIPAAHAKGLQLQADVHATPEARVWADPVRLVQILGNLVSNAMKFTPRGGVVDISTRAEAGGYAVTVRDTGSGIPRQSLGLIFDSFYQVNPGGGAGLGLGLSVVKQLVELHGGSVCVESDGEGHGAAFTVWLTAPRGDG